MPTLGDRLRELIREAEQAGQKAVKSELASACKVKKASVSGWLSGESKSMKPENLVAAADHFKVEIRWLAIGAPPKRKQGQDATARDTPTLDAFRLTAEERDAMARHIRARINHHDIAPTKLAKLMGISPSDALYLTERATESLPALKRLLDALPHTDGKPESMDFIVWGLSRFAVPLDGPAAQHIEAARERTRKAAVKKE